VEVVLVILVDVVVEAANGELVVTEAQVGEVDELDPLDQSSQSVQFPESVPLYTAGKVEWASTDVVVEIVVAVVPDEVVLSGPPRLLVDVDPCDVLRGACVEVVAQSCQSAQSDMEPEKRGPVGAFDEVVVVLVVTGDTITDVVGEDNGPDDDKLVVLSQSCQPDPSGLEWRDDGRSENLEEVVPGLLGPEETGLGELVVDGFSTDVVMGVVETHGFPPEDDGELGNGELLG
jgi:hypothetical protein